MWLEFWVAGVWPCRFRHPISCKLATAAPSRSTESEACTPVHSFQQDISSLESALQRPRYRHQHSVLLEQAKVPPLRALSIAHILAPSPIPCRSFLFLETVRPLSLALQTSHFPSFCWPIGYTRRVDVASLYTTFTGSASTTILALNV